jgi:putative sugar O-methyltransferase
MKINNIQDNSKKIAEFFSEIQSEVYGNTERASLLWQEIFNSRINFPTLDQFMVFRRNGATYGVGDPAYSSEELMIKHCKKNALLLREDGVTDDFLAKVKESPLGAPHLTSEHVLEFEASPNFLKNLRNAFRIFRALKDHFGEKEIKICEIGAGYGLLASMLHQLFNVKSYTVIDLPQNLYLTSLYLTSLYPDKSIQFINRKHEVQKSLQELNFVFAGDLGMLDSDYDFDLILNIDSFGEMNREAASEYVQWAKGKLSSKGVLHTDNRVRVRNCSGVMNFSSLGYLSGFEIMSMDGTRNQAELLSQPHHICFLRRKDDKSYPINSWDLTSILYTIGLANSIQTEVSNEWLDVDNHIIDTILNILTSKTEVNIDTLTCKLEGLKRLPPYANFIVFLVRFAQGQSVKKIPTLNDYISAGMKEPADAIARFVQILDLAVTIPRDSRLQSLVQEFNIAYPHLSEDLTVALNDPAATLRAMRGFAAETITANTLNTSFWRRVQRRIFGNYLAS